MNKWVFPISFVVVGMSILGFTYGPLLGQESRQLVRSRQTHLEIPQLVPRDTDFGIVIPKIGANSSVVAHVDPNDAGVYQLALSKGVAHAQGSVLPGEPGTVFLFAHSSVNFFEAQKYNSIFYLLHWLQPTDTVEIFYHNKQYIYGVTSVEFVDPNRVEYLYQYQPEEQLVLMTCWPPGTTLKRLLVVAKRLSD